MHHYLHSFSPLSPQEIAAITTSTRTLKKNDYFICNGHSCKEVAYINKGIFRSYYINDKGEEVTSCFMFEGSFITTYASFLTQEPTGENIQAITDAEIVVIPYEYIKEQERESTATSGFLFGDYAAALESDQKSLCELDICPFSRGLHGFALQA
ncbi:MAG: Crp/Fnr family transcriptional regulator [Chitinophaga sp.]|uniref:Crp/Fnr family transcriptional regulator n=1 Tax=Chitinophaga sp. TaxID=1869181 RepID=UPI0025C4C891|nr:Crp/Fnr family transcriptional regulator [Chitinophaga sp.]MBV8251867.1 Crp/Fnr family transcriptional regulator [Chitinophaga sp.]